MRIIYIAGYGRSGSTILDMLLDSHPELNGTGELNRIFEQWVENRTCSCSQPIRECAFWSQVMSEIEKRSIGDFDPDEARKLTDSVERITALWPYAPSLYRARLNRYRDLWLNTFEAIQEVTEGAIPIDSSKSNYRTSLRPYTLSMICGLQVEVIHLVRDPRGVMWSFRRGSNEALESGQGRISQSEIRGLIGWSVANVTVSLSTRAAQFKPVEVRYEDLAAQPQSTIERVGNACEMDMTPVLKCLQRGLQPKGGHGIAGNRVRRAGPLVIRPDLEWQEKLPNSSRLLAALAWPLRQRYGY